MPGTARLYFDTTVALAIMAMLGVIAGFIAMAVTGDRMLAMLATVIVFVLAGAVSTLRLWLLTRKPMPPSAPTGT